MYFILKIEINLNKNARQLSKNKKETKCFIKRTYNVKSVLMVYKKENIYF